jgi:hypothetical protein
MGEVMSERERGKGILRLGIAFTLAVGLMACSAQEEKTEQITVPPLTGEQLDRVRQQALDAGLRETAAAQWTTVNWMDDKTNIVVHVRSDELADPEGRDSFCKHAIEVTQAELLPGQSLMLFIVGSDGVYSCRPDRE